MTLRIAVALAVLLVAAPVLAQQHPRVSPQAMVQARELFEQGAAAYDAGRYAQALDLFHRSYDLSHEPRLLYNIGLAADRLRHDDEAIEAFQGFLNAVNDSEHRAVVESRLSILRQAVADRERTAAADRAARDAAIAAERARADAATAQPHGDGGIASQWWFWTIIGIAAVAIGVTVGVVVATSNSPQFVDRPPIPGDDGRTITTLSFP